MFGKACSLAAITKYALPPSYAFLPFFLPRLFLIQQENFDRVLDFNQILISSSRMKLPRADAVPEEIVLTDDLAGDASERSPRCDETEQTIVKPIFGLPCKDYQSCDRGTTLRRTSSSKGINNGVSRLSRSQTELWTRRDNWKRGNCEITQIGERNCWRYYNRAWLRDYGCGRIVGRNCWKFERY